MAVDDVGQPQAGHARERGDVITGDGTGTDHGHSVRISLLSGAAWPLLPGHRIEVHPRLLTVGFMIKVKTSDILSPGSGCE